MKKQFALLLALGLALAPAAHASDLPQGSRYDGRIQYVNYNPDDVVILRALPGLASRVVFAADEEVLDVASGFTQGWEFNNRANILYIKPRSIAIKNNDGGASVMAPEAGKWNTNLMVKTNRRMYDFDLRLLSGGGNSGAPPHRNVAYRVEFRYPAAQAKAATASKTQAKLNEKPAPVNWAYSMQIGDASENIAPTMAYDDGRFTYLKFPNNRDFPAVFTVAADKSESLVNTHVDKDVLVVQRVSKELVLRLGNAVVGIYNEHYDADGVPPLTGTTVPGVKRNILGDDHE